MTPRAIAPALACAVLLSCRAAQADGLADYHHTQWTAADGAPLGARALAQTRDGWLWIGTPDGLYRFDGVRFERRPLPYVPGRSSDRIDDLHAAPNGDLIIGHLGEGVSLLHPDGSVTPLPPQPAPYDATSGFAVDTDGSIWAVGTQILHLVGGRWHAVPAGPAAEKNAMRSLLLDTAGHLWSFQTDGVWRLDRAAGRFDRVFDVGGLPLLAPDGRLWLRTRAGTLHLVDAGPGGRGARGAGHTAAETRMGGLFDADGTLWLPNCPQTVCRVPAAALGGRTRLSVGTAPAERLAGVPYLSGVDARAILEDREGDIWVSTEGGIDRLRRNRLLASGLPGSGIRYSLAADGAGRVWAADEVTGTLWRLAPDAPPVRVPGPWTALVAAGADGALLVGTRRSIQRRHGDAVEEIPLPPGPDGKPRDHTVLGILDDGKVLWTATNETGLIGWRDGKWRPRAAFNLPAAIYQSGPAGPGAFWAATRAGTLERCGDGPAASYPLGPVGIVSAILPGDPLLVSGTGGTALLDGAALRLLHTQEPGRLRNLSGGVVSADGDRWLNGAAGLVHVRADDWRRALADPTEPLRHELFDLADGYPGQAAFANRWRGIVSGDGRTLWLSATGGVVHVDSAGLRRNRVPPTAVILGVTADGGGWPAQGPVTLPPGTRHFRVTYTAPALRMPERVRFEYRLDGVDTAWLDGGTRRATTFSNLGPGDYVFRVRAINEDGVAGPTVAALPLHIEPTLVQTVWFKLGCAGAAVLLGIALYRARMRYVTRRVTERLQVKTAERERIARTLHDTFLQTVQGLVLRVDAVAATLPPETRARRQLETVLDDASHVIGEGREQLQELRAGDAHVLEDVLGDAIARLKIAHGAGIVDLHVEDERRALLAPVADEIAEIAREALRNAFAHAQATRIRVTLTYGRRALTLCVADDGRGLPEPVRRDGARSGHWGLVGMRERAARIGGRIDITGGPRQGTTVLLTVPAARAYAAP